MKTFTLFWAPEGKPIFRTQAKSLEAAKRKVNHPGDREKLDDRLPRMLKVKGEIYWESATV